MTKATLQPHALHADSNQSVQEAVLHAISQGDKVRLERLIRPITKNRIKNDWLKHAVELNQFDCFRLMVEKKGTVRCEVISPYHLYGKTLRATDTRYLATLMEHGAYESVMKHLDPQSPLATRTFFRASAESLSFLQKNGYTLGLSKGVEAILRSYSNQKTDQLNAIEDQIICELDVSYFALAIEYLIGEGFCERVQRLLAGRDTAFLLHSICNKGDMQSLNRLIEGGIDLMPVNSTCTSNAAIACRQRVREARKRIIQLLEGVTSDY